MDNKAKLNTRGPTDDPENTDKTNTHQFDSSKNSTKPTTVITKVEDLPPSNPFQEGREPRLERVSSTRESIREGREGDRRDSLSIWMTMGLHRGDVAPTAASIRRQRRMSRNPTISNDDKEKLAEMVKSQSAELERLLNDTRLEDLAPGTRVMFLLNDQDEVPSLFTEMGELTRSGDVEEWRETARWVKFEEDVEEGGNRWSKPHVATLSLHALFQLRSCLLRGVVLIDLDCQTLPELIDAILDELIRCDDLHPDERENVREVLNRRHTHQYEQARPSAASNGSGLSVGGAGFLSAVRSISDIGRSFSHGKNLQKAAGGEDSPLKISKTANQLELPKVGSMPKDMSKESSQQDFSGRNVHFMKKLPASVEASNVLVGEVGFLSHHISAFVRLKNSCMLGDLTEVPVPTKFLFLLLGPSGHSHQFKEIGRAISTLMSDEIFHDVAYRARNRNDLLDGVDEFLDSVTVLPPGEWDPEIRIEPPSSVPSQQKRVQAQKLLLMDSATVNGKGLDGRKSKRKSKGSENGPKKRGDRLDEDEGHGSDPALKRTGKLFGGLVADIRRKLPWLKSDFTDALNLQCVATFCFMYFALLAPIVTFGGLLEEATHQRMAAIENLASGALCGIIYHLFGGQPLTIIGSTGPVLVFETIVYDLCVLADLNYLSFRFWVNVWTALILFIMVATDASSLVSYITRFTEESFATLIAVIFIYEAIVKLYKISDSLDIAVYKPPSYFGSQEVGTCRCIPTNQSEVGRVRAIAQKFHYPVNDLVPNNVTSVDYEAIGLSKCKRLLGELEGDSCYVLYDKVLMSLVLMLGTFFLAIKLKKMRSSRYFPSKVRQLVSDFAVMISIVIMTVFDMSVGINTPKLNVPHDFRPTWEGRGWLIYPFDGNPLWSALLAFIPSLLSCILIFMDQQITTVIVNRKENKLKKGCGYHLDLLVLSFLIFLTGLFGLPIYVAATVLSINHVNSLKQESESRAPGVVAHFIGVREQRVTGMVTFMLIGLSVTMTKLLGFIPMPVLYGVFLYMGISALKGIQLFDRILLMLMPMKYQPDTIYIRHVPIGVIHRYTICQVLCLALLWFVKSIKATSISFPIMLVVMVAVRKLMERCFSERDLKYLDDKMPDFHLRKREDMKQKRFSKEIDIDLDEGQGTIHAVKTEAHLHIPMNSGNVIKIPLAAIQDKPSSSPALPGATEPSEVESDEDRHHLTINISKEVNSSGMWQWITSNKTLGCSGADEKAAEFYSKPMNSSTVNVESNLGNTNSPPLATSEDDEEPITINIMKQSPPKGSSECQPLLPGQIPPTATAYSRRGQDESAV